MSLFTFPRHLRPALASWCSSPLSRALALTRVTSSCRSIFIIRRAQKTAIPLNTEAASVKLRSEERVGFSELKWLFQATTTAKKGNALREPDMPFSSPIWPEDQEEAAGTRALSAGSGDNQICAGSRDWFPSFRLPGLLLGLELLFFNRHRPRCGPQ